MGLDSVSLSPPFKNGEFNIALPASKSISNRVLLIQKLCGEDVKLSNLSKANDTIVMAQILNAEKDILNAGHAGTAFRFATAYLSLQTGKTVLTGSKRMLQRPIGILVDALNELGADIRYMGAEGFPPLEINAPKWKDNNKLGIDANISSQFISAILMIAPILPNGIVLKLNGNISSKPYIKMTLDLMGHFGIKHIWSKDNIITIRTQSYISKSISIEADWSAASYWFGLVALNENLKINLNGLHENSIQGDSKIVEIMSKLGVTTEFNDFGISIHKTSNFIPPSMLEFDLEDTPDLVQTISVVCAALGVSLLMTGIESLKIKETDRVLALQQELQKFNVFLTELPKKFSSKSSKVYYLQEGKAVSDSLVTIETYEDHRMALAFSILSLHHSIKVINPEVVNKSYPTFWNELYRIKKPSQSI